MAGITNRTFPFVLLFIWLLGVTMLFCTAVYGDFDILVDSARKGEIQRELGRITENLALSVRKTASKSLQAVEEYERQQASKLEAEVKQGLKWTESGGEKKQSGPWAESGKILKSSFKTSKEAFSARLSFAPHPPKHKWFTMSDPAILVLDFQGEWKQQVQRRQEFSSGPISKVIFGRHPEYLRMVLYYSPKYAEKSPPPVIKRQEDQVMLKVPAQ
ncbi:MAG: AMIN domain-containing protein [Desulfohalobiaceae bacterium]